MGQLDEFAKEVFAEETAGVTGGAAAWVAPAEIGLTSVRIDGLLRIREPARVARLAPPWSHTEHQDEIVLEIKMPGDHLDIRMLQRALLRRQARNVERVEDDDDPWDGEAPLWIVAPHLPEVLSQRRALERFAPGCHRVGPSAFPFVWIAANDLPLCDELIAFLIARSGRALEQFARWVATRRPRQWVLRMVQILPMSTSLREEMARYVPRTDDPEIRERQRHVARVLLDMDPELQEEFKREGHEAGLTEGRTEGLKEGRTEGLKEGQIEAARAALRQVLTRRDLPLSTEQDARIQACTDLTTLRRWLDLAILAKTADDALI